MKPEPTREEVPVEIISTEERNLASIAPNGQARFLPELLLALQASRNGDFSVRLTGDPTGIEGKIADIFNDIVAANHRMAKELERVGRSVGREGKIKHRVALGTTGGAWGEMESSIN